MVKVLMFLCVWICVQVERRKQEEKMKRDELNDKLLEHIEKQRLYFKTVKDFQEVTTSTVASLIL